MAALFAGLLAAAAFEVLADDDLELDGEEEVEFAKGVPEVAFESGETGWVVLDEVVLDEVVLAGEDFLDLAVFLVVAAVLLVDAVLLVEAAAFLVVGAVLVVAAVLLVEAAAFLAGLFRVEAVVAFLAGAAPVRSVSEAAAFFTARPPEALPAAATRARAFGCRASPDFEFSGAAAMSLSDVPLSGVEG